MDNCGIDGCTTPIIIGGHLVIERGDRVRREPLRLFLGKIAQVAVCVEALPLMVNSWMNGGGSTSIGLSGGGTLGAPSGGGDLNASVMLNADSWGNVSLTTSTAYNPMGLGIVFPSAGVSGGVTVATSDGSTKGLTGQSLQVWGSYGPVSIQASKSANNGPVSSGMTLGGGLGLQVAAGNVSTTKEKRSTNCVGAATTLAQWGSKLF